MLKCGGSRGDVEKRGKVCWGVGEKWESVESGESTGRDVGWVRGSVGGECEECGQVC